jgi:PAS domain-containing protein
LGSVISSHWHVLLVLLLLVASLSSLMRPSEPAQRPGSAANAIAIVDRKRAIQWVSQAFARLTAFERGEAVGQNPRLLKSGVTVALMIHGERTR